MKKNYQRKSEGFTIVETLIVLAIVGVMMLVVFLAVPALQRNSRNTAIKSDVQSLLGGISEFQSNNDGKFPTSVAGTGDVTINNGTGAGSSTQTTKISGSTTVTTVTTTPTSVAAGSIQVFLGHRCDGTTSARAVSAYYNIETSGNGTNLKCQDS